MVRITANEDVVTAYIIGDIDHHNAKDIREMIDDAVDSFKPQLLILDFKDVAFMDSSGIGLVMGRYKLMNTLDGCVRVTNSTEHINKVMRLAGLDKLAVIGK